MSFEIGLAALLRQETKGAHAQLEKHKLLAGLAVGVIPVPRAQIVVGRMASFWRELERRRPAGLEPLIARYAAFGPWNALAPSLAAAAAFGASLPDWPDPVPDGLDWDWLDGAAAWVGAVYVREGAAHGGKVLGLTLAPRPEMAAAVAFFRRDGAEPTPWAPLQQAIDRLAVDGSIDPAVTIHAAQTAFARLSAWLSWSPATP